jgi:hypothetical protein
MWTRAAHGPGVEIFAKLNYCQAMVSLMFLTNLDSYKTDASDVSKEFFRSCKEGIFEQRDLLHFQSWCPGPHRSDPFLR